MNKKKRFFIILTMVFILSVIILISGYINFPLFKQREGAVEWTDVSGDCKKLATDTHHYGIKTEWCEATFADDLDAGSITGSPPQDFFLAQDDTWDDASARCDKINKKLCTKDQICTNGKDPVFNGKAADTWTPIAGKNNWLQIQNPDPKRLCQTHMEVAKKNPDWGNVKTMKGFRNTLICCD